MALLFKVPARIQRLSRTPVPTNVQRQSTAPKKPTREPEATPDSPRAAVETLDCDPMARRLEDARREKARYEQARQAFTSAIEALNNAVCRLREEFSQKQQELEAVCVNLALAIAEKVIRTEVEAGKPVAARLVQEILQRVESAQALRIVAHPDDVETIKTSEALKAFRDRTGCELHFRADASITRGGCRVETDFGDFDATIESQLRLIREHIAAGEEPE